MRPIPQTYRCVSERFLRQQKLSKLSSMLKGYREEEGRPVRRSFTKEYEKRKKRLTRARLGT